MLSSLIETILTALVNGPRPHGARRAAPPRVAAGHAILGHTLPLLPGQPDAYGGSEAAVLSPADRLRHVYAIGATGSGKTNLLLRLIESDIASGQGFAVVDLRGDLVDRILRRMAVEGDPEDWRDRLVLLDLRDTAHTVPFNPLQGPGDPYTRALYVLSTLRQQAESWGVQLEETLRNALVALAESGWSLLELEPLLSNAAFRAEVMARVGDRYVRSFFDRYDALSEERQVAWRLPVLNKASPLLCLPRLRLLFGHRDSLDLGALLDRPGTVILIALAVDQLHDAAHLAGGLLVGSIQNAVMARAGRPEAERRPFHLYVDEFETMATEKFEAIVAEGRRFGLGLTLAHQNLSQLPADLRAVLRNNVHTQLYFQTGSGDAAALARDVVCSESREDVTTALMTQGVGEAFLVSRGKPSVRIRIPPYPDQAVPAGAVDALRAVAFRSFAVPRAAAEAELKRREEYLDGLADPPGATPNKTKGKPEQPPPPAPTYVIRHGKTTRFHPKNPRKSEDAETEE